VAAQEPWPAVVMVPAALAVLAGFGSYGQVAWQTTAGYRAAGRRVLRAAPSEWSASASSRRAM